MPLLSFNVIIEKIEQVISAVLKKDIERLKLGGVNARSMQNA